MYGQDTETQGDRKANKFLTVKWLQREWFFQCLLLFVKMCIMSSLTLYIVFSLYCFILVNRNCKYKKAFSKFICDLNEDKMSPKQ